MYRALRPPRCGEECQQRVTHRRISRRESAGDAAERRPPEHADVIVCGVTKPMFATAIRSLLAHDGVKQQYVEFTDGGNDRLVRLQARVQAVLVVRVL